MSVALAVAGCATPISGSPASAPAGSLAVSSTPTTTTPTGLPHVTFDPCKDVPASVIAQLQLDERPPRLDTQTDGQIENVFCKLHSRGDYYLTIAASNYTLDNLRKADNYWGYQELVIGGRRALFGYGKPEPNADSCALNIAASTGVYGVLVGTGDDSFAPYSDCLTAARTNAEALAPYFPR
ncbi:DUF3558 domain-containing protein [Mycobacterium sp. CBMA271]|uniref:DUF3558 domain-containing protein n=1 Tax=unclassified Mycobacteroides TaxID=2618759 RepID=UPI0012DD4D9E|nr:MULTISPECIES: DUF3558 domain-containing protein [unclassified Mycobacteroides]MUM22503.1 DUF3558 domain-containing protein [Mycobacteroides sp. CBMA 271]